MKTSKKIGLGILAVFVVAVAVVGGYWFSMPVGQRNMVNRYIIYEDAAIDLGQIVNNITNKLINPEDH